MASCSRKISQSAIAYRGSQESSGTNQRLSREVKAVPRTSHMTQSVAEALVLGVPAISGQMTRISLTGVSSFLFPQTSPLLLLLAANASGIKSTGCQQCDSVYLCSPTVARPTLSSPFHRYPSCPCLDYNPLAVVAVIPMALNHPHPDVISPQ